MNNDKVGVMLTKRSVREVSVVQQVSKIFTDLGFEPTEVDYSEIPDNVVTVVVDAKLKGIPITLFGKLARRKQIYNASVLAYDENYILIKFTFDSPSKATSA
jgi:TRAP-type C4-dicarboxylate transport system substrate-binding protein